MKNLCKQIKTATKLAYFLKNISLQVCFDHFIEIIATKSDKVEHLYSFYARSPNEVKKRRIYVRSFWESTFLREQVSLDGWNNTF